MRGLIKPKRKSREDQYITHCLSRLYLESGAGKTTLPQAFARIAKGGGIDGVPLRFRLLLESSDENELRDNLLNALAVLRREGIAINWTQLLFDAANWVISPETVANRWSQSYLFALRRTAEKRGES